VPTTVRTELDDANVVEAFKRISTSGKSAAKSIDEGFNQSNRALQVTSGALNMLNPQFAQYAQLIGKGGVAWAAVAATVGAAGKAINDATKRTKEGIDKDSMFGKLLDASDDPSAGWVERTGGKFLAWLHNYDDGIEDLRNQWRELDRSRKMTIATEESAKNLDEVRKSIAMSAANEQHQQAIDRMQSIEEINAALEAEDARIARIAARGKLSDEKAQESAAKQNALLAKRSELEATYMAMQKNLGSQGAQGQLDNILAQEHSLAKFKEMYAEAATEAGNLAEAGRLTADQAERIERIQSGSLAKQQEIIARQQQVGRNQAATDRAMAFDREMEAAETVVDLKTKEAELEREMIRLRTDDSATLVEINEAENQILMTKQKVAEIQRKERDFTKDLGQAKETIARKTELDMAVSLRQVRSKIREDAERMQRLNEAGVGTDRQRNALQQEMLGLLEKEADLKKKNLDATVDDLKKHFAIFAIKDKDRAADFAAKGGLGGGGAVGAGPGQQQAGGQPQGWQQWGGPVGRGPQPFWQGGPGSIWGQGGGGQGGAGGNVGGQIAGGGGQDGDAGGGPDFFGQLMGAPANRANRNKFRKDVRKLTKDKLEQQLSDIDDDFAIAMDEAGNDPDAIHKANKQKGARRKRAKDDFKSGRTKEEAQGELLDDAANKMADNIADNAGLGRDATEALTRLANEAVAKQAEITQLRAKVAEVNDLLRTLSGKRAAANQQAGSRF